MEQAIAERLIRFTVADLQTRCQLIMWIALACAVALWTSPGWLPMLFRAL